MRPDEIGENERCRIAELVGDVPTSFKRVSGGYTATARWTFRAGDRSFFAKIGTTEHTRTELRHEIAAYEAIRGDFMPSRIAGQDHETAPILILEDLSSFRWPTSWLAGDVDAVLATLARVHGETADLPTFAQRHGRLPNWHVVADDNRPFLSLGLVSERWLKGALPVLLDAAARCQTAGGSLTHWDVRSDNICIRGGKAKLVDWNNACLSNPRLDIGFWLPSLAFEGGPNPESLLPDEPEIAAFVAGYFAARAGLPEIEDAPFVRRVQKEQLGPAMAWAVCALDLPPS